MTIVGHLDLTVTCMYVWHTLSCHFLLKTLQAMGYAFTYIIYNFLFIFRVVKSLSYLLIHELYIFPRWCLLIAFSLTVYYYEILSSSLIDTNL